MGEVVSIERGLAEAFALQADETHAPCLRAGGLHRHHAHRFVEEIPVYDLAFLKGRRHAQPCRYLVVDSVGRRR